MVEHLERTDATFAQAWWHWWFLGQTDKPAERVISADPDAWYRTPDPAEMGAGNHADVWAAYHDPAVVHGMCEDYRAGLGIDRDHDEADRAPVAGSPARPCCSSPPTTTSTSTAIPAAIWAPWLAQPLTPPHHRQRPPPGRGGARPGRRGDRSTSCAER